MKKTVRKIGVLFLSTFMIMSLMVPIVSATSGDVGIEPAYPDPSNERTDSIFIMQLKPGEQGQNGVRFFNSSKETHTLEIYPTDSVPSVSGSFSCRQRAEKIKEVGAWVTLDKTKLTIDPGEQAVVDFTVDVPKGTDPGEHDGCIAVQDNANLPAKSGSGVLLGVRSAIRLAVTVPGKIIKKLDILRVEVKHVEGRDISVSPIAKNSGNVSLDVTARAQLVSIFGQETAVKGNAKYPIMQHATTGWAYIFDGPYWGGVYKARTSLSYNADPKSGLGQGETNQQRIRKDSGWFVAYPHPLAAVAELAFIIALLWVIITPLRRRLRRHYGSKHWQKHVVTEGETLATIAAGLGVKWRKIAKYNRMKAPYLVKTGQTLLVPKPGARRNKRVRPSKKTTSELDWLTNDNPASVTQKTSASPAKLAPLEPQAASEPITPPPAQDEWQTPQAQSAVPSSYVAPVSHTRPAVAPNPLFPEPEDTGVSLDWREGASEEELQQLGVIKDSTAVADIQGSWSIDDEEAEKPAKKTTVKKSRSTGTPKKSVTKKTPAKHSSKKKR